MLRARHWGLAALLALAAGEAGAATPAGPIDGSQLSLAWALPFAGVLLSIMILPLASSRFWERNFGKIALFWIAATLLPFAVAFGPAAAAQEFLHVLLVDYVPFLVLLFSLFVVAGGINVTGNLVGTPATNLGLLAFAASAASLIGSVGACMLLIRPLIRANRHRVRKAHIFIFLIFLGGNIGGSLTPLGNPPLFLGFLQGVSFAWTVTHMMAPMLLATALLLAVFYLLDRRFAAAEPMIPEQPLPRRVEVEGMLNLLLLAGIIGAVMLSGVWESGIMLNIFGIGLPLEGVLRDVTLLVLAWLSWKTTRPRIRIENAFTWTPIQEVAILFAAIFLTMAPTLAILRAGSDGAAGGLLSQVRGADGAPIDAAFFWLAGLLSSVLDNAPTYLVFFNVAGGDAETLMGPLSRTLLAISVGATFMGANTYIGNAPNFMVKSICDEHRLGMPSFLGYVGWAGLFLGPLYLLLTVLFFWH